MESANHWGYNTLLALPGTRPTVSPSDESVKEASMVPQPPAHRGLMYGERRSNMVDDRDVNSRAQKSRTIDYEIRRNGSKTQGFLLVDTCHRQAY